MNGVAWSRAACQELKPNVFGALNVAAESRGPQRIFATHKDHLGDRLDSLQFIALLGFIARLAEQIYEQAKGSWVTLR
jgi:hypothetical protein